MEKADLETLLLETARSLPVVHSQEAKSGDDQGEDEEEEREGEGSGGGLVSVFSRVDHLTVLDLHGAPSSARTATQTDTAGNKGDEEGERTKEGRRLGFEGGTRLHCGDCSADVLSTACEDSPSTSRTTQLKRSEPPRHEAQTGDMDWGQFKSTFMEQLSEGAGKRTDTSTAAAATAIKEHLMIEAVSAFKSAIAPKEETAGNTLKVSQTGLTSPTGQTGTADTQCNHTPGGHDQSSHSQASHTQEAAILSTSLLAGIDLAQLDNALEEIEVGGASGQGLTQEGQRLDLPPLKMVWGGSGGGSGGSDLMNQLVVVNQATLRTLPTNRTEGGEERREEGRVGKVSSPPLAGVPTRGGGRGEGAGGGEKETMYVDLRLAEQHWNRGRKLTELEKQKLSNSDSEESDDQMSWLVKRRQMKSSISPLQSARTHIVKKPHHSVPDPRSTFVESQLQTNTQNQIKQGSEDWEERKRGGELCKRGGGDAAHNTESTKEQSHVRLHSNCTNEGLVVGESPTISAEILSSPIHLPLPLPLPTDSPPFPLSLHLSSGSSSSSVVETSQQGQSSVSTKKHLIGIKGRQRSSESITPSSEPSSPSDGEISLLGHVQQVLEESGAGKQGTGKGSKGKKPSTKKQLKKKRKGKSSRSESVMTGNEGAVNSSPEAVRAEKGVQKRKGGVKKKEKEEEKVGEGEKGGGRKNNEVWDKQRLLSTQKAAQQRRRYDSLTTSSDEERMVDPLPLSRVEELTEPPPEEEEQEGEGKVGRGGAQGRVSSAEESRERLRQRLEQKIMSKKPPAIFVTPATDPVFHQDASFSAVLPVCDPSLCTDTLLILPLSPTHGLVSLPHSSQISPEAHLTLHCLLFTYLIVFASQGLQSGGHRTWGSKRASLGGSPGRGPMSQGKLQVRITAVHKTKLDGQLVVMAGVSLPQGRTRSMSYPRMLPSQMKKPLKGQTSSMLLSPLDTPPNPAAIELQSMLCGLKVADLVGEIMKGEACNQKESNTENGRESKVAILPCIRKEIQPLLEMSADTLFSVHHDPAKANTPISFYWHSLYQPSCLPSAESLKTPTVLQTTVCLLPLPSLLRPDLVFHVLHDVRLSGLDVAGSRLVPGEPCLPLDLPTTPSNDDVIADTSLVLALALRGPDAVYRCMEVLGPEDFGLAKVINPTSIVTRFGCPDSTPVYCIRTPFRTPAALSKWFGGRACLETGSLLGMTDPQTRRERRKRQRVRFSESEIESEDNLPPPPAVDFSFPPLVPNQPLLLVVPYSQILLVVSPLLPPSSYSSIFTSCGHLGYDISAVKRVRLNSKRVAGLGIPPTYVSHFTPSSVPPSPSFADLHPYPLSSEYTCNTPPLPSLLLLLGRENALVHSCGLKLAILEGLRKTLQLNPQLEIEVSLDKPVGAFLNAVSYTPERLKTVGSLTSIASTTSSSSSSSSLPQLDPEWERGGERYGEEIAFLALTGCSELSRAVETLHSVFSLRGEQSWTERGDERAADVKSGWEDEDRENESQTLGGFELLGMKLIPQLFRYHAKQLCPVSTSDQLYQKAIQQLSDSPTLVLVLRGIAANCRLHQLLKPKRTRCSSCPSSSSLSSLSLLLSNSLSQAVRFAAMFFSDKELFCDAHRWTLASFVPSKWARADVLYSFRSPPLHLHSVVVVRSEGWSVLVRGEGWRVLVKMLERLCRVGFKVCGLTMRRESEKEKTKEEGGRDNALFPGTPSQVGCYCVAVCVARVNAVWYLCHELRSFLSPNKQTSIHCPNSFQEAVSLVHRYFPRGVCGLPGTAATDYGILTQEMDDFSGVSNGLSAPPHTTLPTSPLTEGTCIILPPSHLTLLTHHTSPLYLRLIELIAQTSFFITGAQLTHFSESVATSLYGVADVEVKELMAGPCLILLLQRDNAASCFKYILKSVAQYSIRGEAADVERLISGAIVPDSPSMASAVFAALQKEE